MWLFWGFWITLTCSRTLSGLEMAIIRCCMFKLKFIKSNQFYVSVLNSALLTLGQRLHCVILKLSSLASRFTLNCSLPVQVSFSFVQIMLVLLCFCIKTALTYCFGQQMHNRYLVRHLWLFCKGSVCSSWTVWLWKAPFSNLCQNVLLQSYCSCLCQTFKLLFHRAFIYPCNNLFFLFSSEKKKFNQSHN